MAHSPVPKTMHAILLQGHGGFDQLKYCSDVPVPLPPPSHVLIRVSASSLNNTDINTRIGWYSKTISSDTNSGASSGFSCDQLDSNDASWSGVPLKFPLIQGADCCGIIVGVGEGVDPSRVGERVIVRTMLRYPVSFNSFECWTFGSECNGGFAQYTVAPSADTYSVKSTLSDIELASIPCAYSTAEGMIQRAKVNDKDRVLITGASGGVGSAAIQLAKCRGAEVIAIVSAGKIDQVASLGADRIIDRESDIIKELGENSVTVVLDLVGGKKWAGLLKVLKRGGRYASSGAIAGPLVELDLRTLYLKDLSLLGCTFQEDSVFEKVIQYIEEERIKPLVSRSYPLSEIVAAQKDFLDKKYAGKLVLIPPE